MWQIAAADGVPLVITESDSQNFENWQQLIVHWFLTRSPRTWQVGVNANTGSRDHIGMSSNEVLPYSTCPHLLCSCLLFALVGGMVNGFDFCGIGGMMARWESDLAVLGEGDIWSSVGITISLEACTSFFWNCYNGHFGQFYAVGTVILYLYRQKWWAWCMRGMVGILAL